MGFSMMFYMMFVMMIIVCMLKKTKIVGVLTVILLALTNAIFFVLPVVSDVLFYDTWVWWVVVQIIANVIVAVCLVIEFFTTRTK